MSKTTIPTGGIANDAIDSQHYADGSIDTAHVADSQITAAKTSGVGGLVKTANSYNTSAVSTLTMDNVFSSSYGIYRVVGYIIPATDATFLMCRFGFGGTVDSGNHYPYRVYNFGMKETDTWQSYANSYGPSSAILMSVSAGSLDMGNATAEHLNGVFRFYNFRSTSFFKMNPT